MIADGGLNDAIRQAAAAAAERRAEEERQAEVERESQRRHQADFARITEAGRAFAEEARRIGLELRDVPWAETGRWEEPMKPPKYSANWRLSRWERKRDAAKERATTRGTELLWPIGDNGANQAFVVRADGVVASRWHGKRSEPLDSAKGGWSTDAVIRMMAETLLQAQRP